ncbi:MAG: Asp23/Gls24 family envelope stress response protein [Chloroflexi bacterium]|nr:Asp23/Gls24 family envelope stress response protein [Chloroflexota bacterium]
MSESSSWQGQVTIAPRVLTTIVRQTALQTEGVQRLAVRSPRHSRVQGKRAYAPGVEVILADGAVHAAVHVITEPDANMLTLAQTLQREIAHAIEHIVGLQVASVDVTIDDVHFPARDTTSS